MSIWLGLLSGASIAQAQGDVDHRAILAELMSVLDDESSCQELFQSAIKPLAQPEQVTFLRGLRSEKSRLLRSYETAYGRAVAAYLPKHLATDNWTERAAVARETLEAKSKEEFPDKEQLREEVNKALSTLRGAYLLTPEIVGATYPQMAEARTKLEHLLLVPDWVRMAAEPTVIVYESPIEQAEFLAAARSAPILERHQILLRQNASAFDQIGPEAARAMRYINLMRCWAGRDPMRFDRKLHAAAQWHVDDMVAKNYYDAFSKVEGKITPEERVAAEGTTFSGAGIAENISDPIPICDSWFTNPGIFRQLFDSRNNRIAVAQRQSRWAFLIGK